MAALAGLPHIVAPLSRQTGVPCPFR